jgi:hypothetical protein
VIAADAKGSRLLVPQTVAPRQRQRHVVGNEHVRLPQREPPGAQVNLILLDSRVIVQRRQAVCQAGLQTLPRAFHEKTWIRVLAQTDSRNL